jgi:uncharacterized protein
MVRRANRTNRELPISATDLRNTCDHFGVVRMWVFGSFLRDDFRNCSDIDLLVEFRPDAEMSLLKLANLELVLEKKLRRKVDLLSRSAVEQSGNTIRKTEILGSAQLVYAA